MLGHDVLPLAQLVSPAANGEGNILVPGIAVNPPTSGVDFFTTAITTPALVRALHITISADDASKFSIILDGEVIALGDLVPDVMAEYKLGVRAGQTLNFEIDSGATVTHFQVDGFYGALM